MGMLIILLKISCYNYIMPDIEVLPHTDVLFRKWVSADPQGVLLLVHGMGAHSERWQGLADYFLAKEFDSYAIELKGFGETKTTRGHIESFQIYYDDLDKFINYLKENYPKKSIYLIGESMGGLIVFDYALRRNNCDGIVCLSPAFKSSLKMSIFKYIYIFWLLIVNPWRLVKMPFNEDMLSTDQQVKEKISNDDRESRDVSAQMLLEIIKSQLYSSLHASKQQIATQFLLAGDDQLVDTAYSKKVFKKIKLENKDLQEFHKMKHALSIEKDKVKVFEEIYKFIK